MAAPSVGDRTGRVVGPYRLISKLGAGAMGEVWRAIDVRLDRAVAVKLLPTALAADPDRRARMLREARAAAAVPHPGVVMLFDVGSDGGDDYLVMELVEGRTLAERLREGPVPLAEALALVLGVAEALAAAHQRGILHRDVKAANVMVTREGVAKVLDFGLAKLREHAPAASAALAAPGAPARRLSGSIALDATLPSQGGSLGATHEGTLLGTPAYFSPEQLQGRLPDEKSEIFSFGVLAYEVVAGAPPFRADSWDGLCEAILRCTPAPLDAPEPLRAAILRALRFAPEDRWPSMAALAAELRRVRAELVHPRRARWPWVAAVLLAVAGAATGGYALLRGPAAAPALVTAPRAPVDHYLDQALGEFDLFYNDKATASLRAAMRVAPGDPRAYAYVVLTGFATDDEQRAASAAAQERLAAAPDARARALVLTAVALLAEGPAAARRHVAAFPDDRELVFWDAELAWRAQAYDDATRLYERLLAAPDRRFRGRVYDHLVACLLYRDAIARAVELGEAYAREFPGEADAVGVQATVYAVAGRLDEAAALAQDALALNESEDSLAGLAKVRALRGELAEAERLYRRAIDQAPAYRRPLRRAALGAVLMMNNRAEAAREATAPCLPGGADAAARTATVCLFVAALADVTLTEVVVAELDARAAALPPLVPYGNADALARLLRARALVERAEALAPDVVAEAERLVAGADSLFVTYHLPFLATYGVRLRAQTRLLAGDAAGAAALLETVLGRRPADVPVLVQLAAAQREAGRRDLALRTVERALTAWTGADFDAAYAVRARRLREELGTL